MIYLHEKQISDTLIRHWANEVSENNNEQEEYEVATYYIKQIETGINYCEAVDIIPCRYTYESTEEPIETEPEPVE